MPWHSLSGIGLRRGNNLAETRRSDREFPSILDNTGFVL
jgi:hypothetical protein